MSQAVAIPQTLVRSATGSSPQMLMRGLVYAPSLPRFTAARLLGRYFPTRALPLSLAAMPEPIARGEFRRLKVRLAGIGKRDIALLYGRQSLSLAAQMSFPAVLGHQILAELGGVRVVVNPVLACLERGLPNCAACERGDDHLCHNLREGNFAPGMVGFCSDFPGGFAPYMLAHRERIFPIPETVSDECAVLTEPLAQVVHGLGLLSRGEQGRGAGRSEAESAWAGQGGRGARSKDDFSVSPLPPSEAMPPSPQDDAPLLIIGGRTLGLLAVKLLRVLGFVGQIHLVARQNRSSELARFLGADGVHATVQAAQQAVGAKRLKSDLWLGGFAAVIETSNTAQGLQEAAWAAEVGGKVLSLGQAGTALVDVAPYAVRQIELLNSMGYSWDSFAKAVEVLPHMQGIEALVTHSFALEAWPEAIGTAVSGRGIKVVFKP